MAVIINGGGGGGGGGGAGRRLDTWTGAVTREAVVVKEGRIVSVRPRPTGYVRAGTTVYFAVQTIIRGRSVYAVRLYNADTNARVSSVEHSNLVDGHENVVLTVSGIMPNQAVWNVRIELWSVRG